MLSWRVTASSGTILEIKATKWCASCEEYKTLDKYWRNKRRYDGLQTHCIECQKQYDIDNPEQRRRRSRKSVRKKQPLGGYASDKAQQAVKDFIDGKEVELPGDSEADEILRRFLEKDITRVGD